MAAAMLRISDDFALPAEVAAEALAILGTKGSGKSSTCAVLAEELWDAAVQFCVFDPTGVFWGLRSSSDGDGDGIPVTILGGPHGDLSAAELVERWREALPAAALDLFDALVASYPAAMTVAELAAATERKPTGGSWNSAVATLVRNGLAEKSGDVLAATDLAAGR